MLCNVFFVKWVDFVCTTFSLSSERMDVGALLIFLCQVRGWMRVLCNFFFVKWVDDCKCFVTLIFFCQVKGWMRVLCNFACQVGG